MKRIIAVVATLVLVPASPALADDLSELLERGADASYSAEQIITCSTPDGVRDAVVHIAQGDEGIHIAAPVQDDVEVTSGRGGWVLSREGAVVNGVVVEGVGEVGESRYEVDDGRAAAFLGRKVALYRMWDGDLLRAELIIDGQTGAVMRAITYNSDGSIYCERRFIAFDPTPPAIQPLAADTVEHYQPVTETTRLPLELAGFTLLDAYLDQDGLVFGYYSDGFFSFAVFETPAPVELAEPSEVETDLGAYERSFSPGQVTYVWEIRTGGMALIGDLPPDMHEAVLADLPVPERQGWLGRLWRSLFG